MGMNNVKSLGKEKGGRGGRQPWEEVRKHDCLLIASGHAFEGAVTESPFG